MNDLTMIRFKVGDLVFAKFRGKWDLGRIELRGITCGMKWYDVSFKTAKRWQRRYEYEMKPTLKLDDKGNIVLPKEV